MCLDQANQAAKNPSSLTRWNHQSNATTKYTFTRSLKTQANMDSFFISTDGMKGWCQRASLSLFHSHYTFTSRKSACHLLTSWKVICWSPPQGGLVGQTFLFFIKALNKKAAGNNSCLPTCSILFPAVSLENEALTTIVPSLGNSM